jgi:Cu/Ag efflux pump CusA
MLGEYSAQLEARNRILSMAIAVAVLILLLLQVVFRSWKLVIAVFITIPVAIVGGILVVLFGLGGILSLGAIIGFLTVISIALRNNIVLVQKYRKMESEGGGSFGSELVQTVTREYAVSVLTTTILTILAFLPMVLFGNIAGLEIIHSSAWVIIGGLITSAFFTLIGVPAIYLLFGENPEPELDFLPDTVAAEGTGV